MHTKPATPIASVPLDRRNRRYPAMQFAIDRNFGGDLVRRAVRPA
jgi:hypothetical protein